MYFVGNPVMYASRDTYMWMMAATVWRKGFPFKEQVGQ